MPLVGDVDLQRVLSTVPRDATIKGMFCARYASAIDEPWEEIAEELAAPPKNGKYTAFDDYPIADYLRLLDRAARNRFPRASTREAYRLLGRGNMEVFAESTLGKVTLSLARTPAAGLTRYPEILGFLTRGAVQGRATAKDSSALLVFPRFVGSIEAVVGLVEGIVLWYEARPRVEVSEDGGGARFAVSWSIASS